MWNPFKSRDLEYLKTACGVTIEELCQILTGICELGYTPHEFAKLLEHSHIEYIKFKGK